MYEMQIKLMDNHIEKWVSIRPTSCPPRCCPPYQYENREDALKMLNTCYPDVLTEYKRVVKVS